MKNQKGSNCNIYQYFLKLFLTSGERLQDFQPLSMTNRREREREKKKQRSLVQISK